MFLEDKSLVTLFPSDLAVLPEVSCTTLFDRRVGQDSSLDFWGFAQKNTRPMCSKNFSQQLYACRTAGILLISL